MDPVMKSVGKFISLNKALHWNGTIGTNLSWLNSPVVQVTVSKILVIITILG